MSSLFKILELVTTAFFENEAWLNTANHHGTEGRVDLAIKIAKFAFLNDPTNIHSIMFLLKIRDRSRELDQFPSPRVALRLSPQNGLALLYKRKHEAECLSRAGKTDGANRILRQISELLPDHAPFFFDTNSSNASANKAWRAGDIGRARSIIESSFERFLSVNSAQGVKGDIYALQYIQLLVHRGFIKNARGLIERLDVVDPVLKEHFYVLNKVATFCDDSGNIAQGSQEIETIYAVLPIWGEPYMSIWERAGLPAFLARESRAFFQNRRVEFHIFTLSSSLKRLRGMPGMRALSELATIHWFNLDDIILRQGQRNFVAMNIAQWATLSLARIRDASVLLVFADMMYSTGSMAFLDRSIRAKQYDLLFTIDLQMGPRAWDDLNDASRFPNGAGRVPAKDLMAVFLDHPSGRELSWRISDGGGHIPLRPFRWSVEKEGTVELRSVVPQPFYLSRHILKNLLAYVPTYLDYWIIESALIGGTKEDRLRILTDPDEFLCATIDLGNAGESQKQFVKVPSKNIPRDTLQSLIEEKLLNQRRAWAIRQPLVIGRNHTVSVLDEIVDLFTVDTTDSSSGIADFLQFTQHVTLAAFDAVHGVDGTAR